MTKNEIIAELFTSRHFNDCIGRMHPCHLRNDLKAEVAVILCGLREKELLTLHSQGKLPFYAAAVIVNLIKSASSPFHKKYRQICWHLNQDIGDEDTWQPLACDTMMDIDKIDMMLVNQGCTDLYSRMEKERVEDIALQEFEKLHWYEHDLMMLYIKLGTYRAVETETGIPHESVSYTIKSTCKKIRESVYEQCRNNNMRVSPGLLLGEPC